MRIPASVAILFCLLPAASFADLLSDVACSTQSYAYYVANYSSPTIGASNGPCANGILNYSGFQFHSFGTESALVSADDITISAIGPGLFQLGETGFTLSGLSVAAGQTATYVFDWFFEIDAGPYAGGGRLGMDPPHGDVTFIQSYCVDSYMSAYEYNSTAPTTCSGNSGSNPQLQTLTVTVPEPDASIRFDPEAHIFATMRTIIQMNGGVAQDGAGFDLLLGTTGIYDSSAVPEPGTLLLIPGAMLITGFVRRRAAKQ